MDSLKVSLRPAIPNPIVPCGRSPLKQVATHNAVFYPLGYPTSYAYSKTERVVFFFSLPYRTGLVVGGLKGLRVALSGSGWPQVGSGWPRGHR